MKKVRVFICGDSFCARDLEYDGMCWVDHLCQEWPEADIVTLASPAASNYLIYLQIKHALENKPDHIIYHATSSIRQEFRLHHDDAQSDNHQRYWNAADPDPSATMLCTSWLNPQRNTQPVFSGRQAKKITEFFHQYIDMASLIEKNYIFIMYSLALLNSNSNKLRSWAWSRGGFEHKNFGGQLDWDFSEYHPRESEINLWDKFEPGQRLEKPLYHIIDENINRETAIYYRDILNKAEG